MKLKHKHNWDVSRWFVGLHGKYKVNIIRCLKCGKTSLREKPPEKKNGCFGGV